MMDASWAGTVTCPYGFDIRCETERGQAKWGARTGIIINCFGLYLEVGTVRRSRFDPWRVLFLF